MPTNVQIKSVPPSVLSRGGGTITIGADGAIAVTPADAKSVALAGSVQMLADIEDPDTLVSKAVLGYSYLVGPDGMEEQVFVIDPLGIALNGSTSGTASIRAAAISGTTIVTMPTGVVTLATTADITSAITGLFNFKGGTDCSANPNYPAASKGWAYIVTVAGKIGGASGQSVQAGDLYFALADNAGGTDASVGTSWGIIEHNLPALGTLSTQNSNAVSITGGTLTGVSVNGVTLAGSGTLTTTGGTLGTAAFTAATAYQPVDSDLTSWAAITRASGFDTFSATPSSANLASLLTDEVGTGSAVFATGVSTGGVNTGDSGKLPKFGSGGQLKASGYLWVKDDGAGTQGYVSLYDSTGGHAILLYPPDTIATNCFALFPAVTTYIPIFPQAITLAGPTAARTITIADASQTLLNSTATGVQTFLTTPSSANLLSAITDETGSGALVFANTPTLIAPLLGTPTSGTLTNCNGTASSLTAGNATLAASATILATARAINGTNFDGSAAITVTAAAGTLTGATLNSTVVSSSLTSVGTIASGTWSGSFGAVSGANLTTLNATNISSGSLADARLSANVPLLNAANTYTGTTNTFTISTTTGTTTTSGISSVANSLTTGTAFDLSSSSLTTGKLVNLTMTGSGPASGSPSLLNIAMTGANTTNAITTTGATISNTRTNATSGTNTALTLTSSGATTANYALNITAGIVSAPITFGVSTDAVGTRQTIVIGNAGYSAPSANNADANGDKFQFYNTSAGKFSTGLDTGFGWWLQCVGASAHFKIYTAASAGSAGTERFRVADATTTVSNALAVTGATTLGGGTSIKNIRHGISGAMVLGAVTIIDTGCTANTRYFFTAHTLGTITVPGGYYAMTRNASTSVVVTSSQPTETSTLDWYACEP